MYSAIFDIKNITLIIIASIVLAGCNVNPTVLGPVGSGKNGELFSEDYTQEIINHVRCEIRDALVREAAGVILRSENGDSKSQGHGQIIPGSNIAEKLLNIPGSVNKFKVWQIGPRPYIRSSLILNSTIGLTFQLDITENNVNSITPAFTSTNGIHALSLGLGAATMNVSRQNRRDITRPPESLSSYQNIECKGDKIQGKGKGKSSDFKDIGYPLRGKVDLDKTIRAYIKYIFSETENFDFDKHMEEALTNASFQAFGRQKDYKPGALSTFRNIAKGLNRCKASDPQCERNKICYETILAIAGTKFSNSYFSATGKNNSGEVKPGITDKLSFTTKISGGLDPTIDFTAVTGSLRLNKLSFGNSNSRNDLHTLTIALTAPPFFAPVTEMKPVVFASAAGYKLKIDVPTNRTVPPETVEECAKKQTVVSVKKSSKKRKSKKRSRSKRKLTSGPIPTLVDSKSVEIQREKDIENRRLLLRDNVILNLQRVN